MKPYIVQIQAWCAVTAHDAEDAEDKARHTVNWEDYEVTDVVQVDEERPADVSEEVLP